MRNFYHHRLLHRRRRHVPRWCRKSLTRGSTRVPSAPARPRPLPFPNCPATATTAALVIMVVAAPATVVAAAEAREEAREVVERAGARVEGEMAVEMVAGVRVEARAVEARAAEVMEVGD